MPPPEAKLHVWFTLPSFYECKKFPSTALEFWSRFKVDKLRRGCFKQEGTLFPQRPIESHLNLVIIFR